MATFPGFAGSISTMATHFIILTVLLRLIQSVFDSWGPVSSINMVKNEFSRLSLTEIVYAMAGAVSISGFCYGYACFRKIFYLQLNTSVNII